jgi:hypothetical protein
MDFIFDVNALSDDELYDKLEKINSKLYMSYVSGNSSQIVNQLTNFAQIIESELRDRYMISMQKAYNDQFPEKIESDKIVEEDTANSKKNSTKKTEKPSNAPRFNKVYRKE